MNPLLRWLRFNLVGAMGMAVQLTALALLNRCARGHYLVASAAALELTLLHNFLWHWHYTWRDRRGSSTPLRAFLRFQLSNGLVSLVGNLALMRLLVHYTQMPLLASNLIAIACCSLATFGIGNSWVFSCPRRKQVLNRNMRGSLKPFPNLERISRDSKRYDIVRE